MKKWSRVKGIECEHGEKQSYDIRQRSPYIDCKLLVKYPCAVCQKGVRNNSIFCSGCSFWIHKKCFNIPDLDEDPDFWCRRWFGNAQAIDGRPWVKVQLADGKLNVVDTFVQLGDCICPGGGYEDMLLCMVKIQRTLVLAYLQSNFFKHTWSNV